MKIRLCELNGETFVHVLDWREDGIYLARVSDVQWERIEGLNSSGKHPSAFCLPDPTLKLPGSVEVDKQ